jgi:hypothetical protein
MHLVVLVRHISVVFNRYDFNKHDAPVLQQVGTNRRKSLGFKIRNFKSSKAFRLQIDPPDFKAVTSKFKLSFHHAHNRIIKDSWLKRTFSASSRVLRFFK